MIAWYQRKKMIQFLHQWSRALVGLYPGFAPPALELKPAMKAVASFNFATKTVTINPTYYAHDARTQYRATKGLVTHEVGHHLFTPTQKGASRLLHTVHNILEDGRIDRLWCRTPGSLGKMIRYLYRLLKRHSLADTESKANLMAPHPSVLLNGCILANWRDHLGLPLDALHFEPSNQRLWEEQILPRTQEAWRVPQAEAEHVWTLSQEILRLLGLKDIADLDRSVLVVLDQLDAPEGEREEEGHAPVTFPVMGSVSTPLDSNSEAEEDEEAAPLEEREEVEQLDEINRSLNRPAPPEIEDWPAIEPQPYLDYEEALRGPVQQVLRLLRPRPVPEDTYRSEDSGRPVPKNIIFTPETPFEERTDPVIPRRVPVDLRVIVDRSGSMSRGRRGGATAPSPKERAAILAAMLIHQVGSKLGMAHEIVVMPGLNRLAGLRSGERGKALIAGIRGTTNREDMNRALQQQGATLLKSRATVRLMYVIHDGYPDSPEACAATIKELRAKGIRVIGVGLELEHCPAAAPAARCGNCEACRMRALFGDGLILTSAEEMPLHIASSLKSLRVFV